MDSRRSKQNIAWGGLMVLSGALSLLELYTDISPLIWSGVLGIAGLAILVLFLTDRSDWSLLIPAYVALAVALLLAVLELDLFDDDLLAIFILPAIALPFFFVYLRNRSHWWALIPAYVLTAIGVVIALTELALVPDDVVGTLILFVIALPFYFVYLRNREHWWALIPAYTLTVIGIMIALIEFNILDDLWVPAYVMLVIALPFYFVYLRNREYWWALVPAGILTLIGLSFIIAESAAELILPVIMIGIGAWLLLRQLLRRGGGRSPEPPEPPTPPAI